MIRKNWLRVLVVAACLTVAVVGVGSIADTHAAVTGPGVTNYYADATYKKIVGTETYGCCGEYSFTGKKTAYRKFTRFYCLDVLCPF